MTQNTDILVQMRELVATATQPTELANPPENFRIVFEPGEVSWMMIYSEKPMLECFDEADALFRTASESGASRVEVRFARKLQA